MRIKYRKLKTQELSWVMIWHKAAMLVALILADLFGIELVPGRPCVVECLENELRGKLTVKSFHFI